MLLQTLQMVNESILCILRLIKLLYIPGSLTHHI